MFKLNTAEFTSVDDWLLLAKLYGDMEPQEAKKLLKKNNLKLLVKGCIGKVKPSTLAIVWNCLNRILDLDIDPTLSIDHMRSNSGKDEMIDLAIRIIK